MNKNDFIYQLRQKIIPFWIKNIDKNTGCYFPEVSNNLKINLSKPVSVIMLYRYLWSFSSAYLLLNDPKILDVANNIYQFINKYSFDSKNGGVHWSIHTNGEIIDDTKHIYTQAFAIYGLTEYYKITSNQSVLTKALDLFYLIEKNAKNPQGGYFEQFSVDWQKENRNKIVPENKNFTSTNTHLHLLEAYGNLYEVCPNQTIFEACEQLIDTFNKYIITSEGYCRQFFNSNWQETLKVISYGHDIEASWLLDKVCNQINIDNSLFKNNLIKLREYSIKQGIDKSTYIMHENNHVQTYTWWVLAESSIGLLYACQLNNDAKFFELFNNHIKFIQKYFFNSAGEWYASINEKLEIINTEPIAGFWKGPYHTVRMYIEIIKILTKLEDIQNETIYN